MIARLVKMTFKPESIQDFLEMFERKKTAIRSFDGCVQLQLLQDLKDANILYTYSNWETIENLEQYRNSQLFAITWKETKTYFAAKAEAVSFNQLVQL